MLRGIRTASANWLGRIVMGVVLGLIAISFAVWGIGDIFRGFGRSSLARIGGTEISIEQFRQLYSERLQQLGRQLGRPITLDQARADGHRPATGGAAHRRSDARRAREGAAARHHRRGDGAPDHDQSGTARPDRPVRSHAFRDDAAQQPDHRAALPRRTAPPDPAAAIGRHRARTERRCRRPRWKPRSAIRTSSAPSNTSCSSGRRPAKSPSRRPKQLAKFFEERKALFRAPEYRKIVMLALLPGEQAMWTQISDADVQRPTRIAARAISRPSAGPFSRSCSAIRRRRRPPPTASPRANRSSTSPRSASSPRRKSISAR